MRKESVILEKGLRACLFYFGYFIICNMFQIQTVDLMEPVCFQELHCFWIVFVEFLLVLHAIKACRKQFWWFPLLLTCNTTRGSLTIIWKNNTLSTTFHRQNNLVLQKCCFFVVILKQILQNTVLGLNPHNEA